MIRPSHTLCACVLVVAYSGNVLAGAWTMPKDQLHVISSVSATTASHYFDTSGKRQRQTNYYKSDASTYLEYGVYDNLTLGGQLTYAYAYQENVGDTSQSNLGDTEIFGRTRLWSDDLSVVSTQASLMIPSPDAHTTMPKIGSDYVGTTLKASYGRNLSIFQRWHYADLAGAYVLRGGHASDQLKLEAAFGFNVDEHWQLLPQIFVTKNRKKIRAPNFTQSSADDYDATKLQFSIQYKFDNKTAVQLGAFGHVDGKNTGVGHGIMFSYIRNIDW